MEILFEIFAQIISEIFAQIIFEIFAEIGLRSLTEPFKRIKPVNPVFAGIGYVLFGAAAGWLSLLLPRIFTVPQWLRILNLILTPIACGYLMSKFGQLREKRQEKTIRIDSFLYGYLFALAMAIVRFILR